MRILGIETSCDDTGIAVLEIKGRKTPHFEILANIVASQIKVHQKYGGVYPTLAKREHIKNLPIVLKKALKDISVEKTDAIAVTYGPGLSPCLWTGLNFAKELAKKWDVPLIPVDHIEGHLLIALLGKNGSIAKNIFPAIALIVSGGHTQLVHMKDLGKYQIIGETRDDAAGECFDKTARILGLPYPGGPEIAREAAQGLRGKSPKRSSGKAVGMADEAEAAFLEKPRLPRPMMYTKDYDFSFSGLKTAVLYDYQARPEKERKSKAYVQAMAAEIQQAIIDVLIHKTIKAAAAYNAKSVILGGGVSANDELRKQLESKTKDFNIQLLAPPKELSTDNGAMIVLAGYFNWLAGRPIKNRDRLEANPNLRLA